MQGERGSVFKSFFLNPLVWIGLMLTAFTLGNKEEENAFDLFFEPDTYRNLAIGAALYVGLFDRHYTSGRNHLDWGETLFAVLKTMYVIILIWGGSLFLIINYHSGGEWYSQTLAAKYKKNGWGDSKTISSINDTEELQTGVSYKVTPNADGSITVETMDE